MVNSLVLLLAATPIDPTTLPPEISGAAIGYELCLFGSAEVIARSPQQPPKPYEIAKTACLKEWGHLDTRIDDYFIERSADLGREFTDQDFAEAEKIHQALAARAQAVFEADLRSLRQK